MENKKLIGKILMFSLIFETISLVFSIYCLDVVISSAFV